MEFGQQINENRNNAKLSLFQNQGYQFERRKTKTVLLDVSSDIGQAMDENFSVKLVEPLIIDTLSDVYLDSFTTFNAIPNNTISSANMGFTFRINELNINSNIAGNQDKSLATSEGIPLDSKKFNSIFIPNSSSGNDSKITVLHKSKKYNYICSINPGKISQLSGELFDAGTVGGAGAAPVYSSPFDTPSNGVASRFFAELVIVSRE